jgi:glyoxylase-like metal-dependent hydrolase (beta-lactamase superfamily II)
MKKMFSIMLLILIGAAFSSSTISAQPRGSASKYTFLPQAPGFFRIMVGDYQVTALNDGVLETRVADLFNNAKPGEVDIALKVNDESSIYKASYNAFLINTGKQLILVDVGAGDIYGGGRLGKVTINLAAAGYKPEDIDAILITHLHLDHIGGLVQKGKVIFPNAKLFMGKKDVDFLFGQSAQRSDTNGNSTLQDYIKMLKPYKEAGKLNVLDGPTQIFPGIRSQPSPGHTPGHNFFIIESKGQKLVFWGDIVHIAEVQFTDPYI